MVQLDLKKAFDKVCHSGILDALRLQGASLQCIAILAAILSNSQVACRLSHVEAPSVSMRRGLVKELPSLQYSSLWLLRRSCGRSLLVGTKAILGGSAMAFVCLYCVMLTILF